MMMAGLMEGGRMGVGGECAAVKGPNNENGQVKEWDVMEERCASKRQ